MKNIFDQMALPPEPTGHSLENALTGAEQAPQPAMKSRQDVPQTSVEIKTAVQELLKHGYLEEANRQELFRRIIIHEHSIGNALEPLDLALRIDTHRGVAFLTIASNETDSTGSNDLALEGEGWGHPLVRKQRLTLEQSLLTAILRQAFVVHEQKSGVGQAPARIAIEELLPHFLTYAGESGSDSKDENRLLQLLDQLKGHGIVSEVDNKHEVTIRPLIAHFANPESLSALLAVLKQKVVQSSGSGDGP